MQVNTILTGDALDVLSSLPDAFVQVCVTSPPYYGLRSFLPEKHADKHLELGLEETPAHYIERLVAVFREVKRVLRKDGVAWINLDDSYGTGCQAKQLLGIPWRVAFALQSDGWILRSDVIWHKGNAFPESVTDRPSNDYEHVFLLAKSHRYYYDGDAIREPHLTKSNVRNRAKEKGWAQGALLTPIGQGEREWNHPLGRNKRAVWSINTHPSVPSAHFATFPRKLIEPCILAGSRPGDIILDCFMGVGTTAVVALQHGRRYVGIELNPAYVELAEQRISVCQPNLWTSQGVA